MKLFFLFFSAVIFASGAPALASAKVQSVYVAIRTDNQSGKGTQADPYDGSTEAKFDAVMQSIQANTQINLGPGTFLTHGDDAYYLKSGWTITGAGEGVTVVKLVDHATKRVKHFNFYGDWVTNVQISDLTCDGNAANSDWPTGQAVGGVVIYGANLVANNIEVINCYGDSTQGQEQFSILLTGSPTELSANCTIENCTTHLYAPGANYTNGPMIAYGNNAKIINCTDDGSNHGYGFTEVTNGEISGCTSTSNTVVAFYTDTGAVSGITIENNTFSASLLPIQFNSQSPSEDVQILNNTLNSSNQTYIAAGAIGFSGATGNNFQIIGNVYTYTGSQANGLILDIKNNTTDLIVEDNSSNVGLAGGGDNEAAILKVVTELSGNKFNQTMAELAADREENSSTNDPDSETSSSSSSTPTPTASTPTTSVSPAPTPVTPAAPQTTAPSAEVASKSGPINSVKEAASSVSALNTGTSAQSTNVSSSVLLKMIQTQPQTVAGYVQSMPEGSVKTDAIRLLVKDWSATDPVATASWLVSLPPTQTTRDLYNTVVEQWTNSEAGQWTPVAATESRGTKTGDL